MMQDQPVSLFEEAHAGKSEEATDL